MPAQVCGCFYPLTLQRATLRALRWLLRGLPDDGACDVPKHVADLLRSDVYIFWCMYSWLYKLVHVQLAI